MKRLDDGRYVIKFRDGTKKVFNSLKNQNLSEADLRFADLRWTDLRNCKFDGADLYQADFSCSDVKDACFVGAENIGMAKFTDSNFKKSQKFEKNVFGSEEEEKLRKKSYKRRKLNL